ncbi:MAG: rhomboid family intramembrane serine protease [Thermodesulfobacteriota bacterium]
MLLIPITGKISWRNPPAVTIALILINVLVFVFFQIGDDRNQFEAYTYYFDSGLSDLEIPRYLEHNRPESVPREMQAEDMNRETLMNVYRDMETDARFQERIESRTLIPPDDPDYPRWRELRRRYEKIVERIVARSYGFRPAHHSILTVFTYMFLHGGFGHLFGNMIFLWLIGCLLEMGCGRLFCAAGYVITGIAAAVLFWLAYMDDMAPLVGASGAIAGLMGAFAVMFGKTRIKLFYSLGFYFNYIRFPAVMLFPLWVGNEVVQLLMDSESNVAYVAHIGGLLSGALFGLVNKKLFNVKTVQFQEEEPANEILPIMEKALQRIGVLDMEGGRKLLEEVLRKDPKNSEALWHLFNIEKIDPQKQRFHDSAKRLLNRLCLDRNDHGKVWDVYQEYTRIAKPPKLTPDIYVRLISVFAGIGRLHSAEKIALLLLKKKPDLQGLSAGLIQLATASRKRGDQDKWKRYLQIVCKYYRDTPECAIAADMLKSEIQKIEIL